MANTYSALFWAYTVIWILIFSYIFLLSQEQKKLKDKIEKLERDISK